MKNKQAIITSVVLALVSACAAESAPCKKGAEMCECYVDRTCNQGLVCSPATGACVPRKSWQDEQSMTDGGADAETVADGSDGGMLDVDSSASDVDAGDKPAPDSGTELVDAGSDASSDNDASVFMPTHDDFVGEWTCNEPPFTNVDGCGSQDGVTTYTVSVYQSTGPNALPGRYGVNGNWDEWDGAVLLWTSQERRFTMLNINTLSVEGYTSCSPGSCTRTK